MTSEPSSTRADRPLNASRASHASRNGAEAFALEFPQHTQKLVQDGPRHPIARRRRGAGIGHRRGLCALRFERGAGRRRQRHIDPHSDHHMSGAAGLGPQLDQHAADLTVLEPDVVRPLQRHAQRPCARQRARHRHAHTQAQGGHRARRIAEGPGQRQCESSAEWCNPAPSPPPAPGMLQLAHADIRRAGRRRSGAQEPAVGGIHFEQQLELAQLPGAHGADLGADALRVQQFHRIRQAVAAPRQRLHLQPQGAQALHALPHGGPAHFEFPRQPFAGAQPAVRQQHQQQGVI